MQTLVNVILGGAPRSGNYTNSNLTVRQVTVEGGKGQRATQLLNWVLIFTKCRLSEGFPLF